VSAIYTGPQCPHCSAPLDTAAFGAGVIPCPACDRTFEGTPFQPRAVRHQAIQVVTETPDGTAAACANHAGNAAVTNCQRCGLFICALCEMNTGHGTYCPSCYERVRTETLQSGARYRDYASMAISGAVIGLLCSFIPVGPFVIYWGYKGIQQRRTEGVRPVGPIVAMVIGSLSTLAMIAAFVAIAAAIVKHS
jgi:uncharacterized Zn finger protein (UPF0148 family)